MSSTWVAEFNNEKDYNHFVNRFKEIAPDGGNVIIPGFRKDSKKRHMGSACIDLNEIIYDYCDDYDEDKHGQAPVKEKSFAISFDIPIWDDETKKFIHCIFHEMCLRYKFVEIGCSSGELVSQEEFLQTDAFGEQKRRIEYWREHYAKNTQQWIDKNIDPDKIIMAEKEIKKEEKEYKSSAKRFFDGDASDLILTYKK
jgi:hypothetical protein